MTLHGDTRIDNYYWCGTIRVLSRKSWTTCSKKIVRSSGDGLATSLAGSHLKGNLDRIPQREVSAPYIKNGYRYGIFMNQAVNMLSTSVNRRSVRVG